MSYQNFTDANITGLPAAFEYASYASGGIFAPLLLIMCFVIFTGVFYPYTKERAIAVSLFICLMPNALMVAAALLNPAWLLINFIALAVSLVLLGRLSN